MPPTLTYEHELIARGHCCIAGIDEAGRGCWAGPVVAAAVVLSEAALADPTVLAGIDDSKLLTATQREICYQRVVELARGVAVGVVPASTIDALGILNATRVAMAVALLSLRCWPDALLIDAVRLDGLRIPQQAIIRGDSASFSIAAASIVAKVSRDRLMQQAELVYPGYLFAQHKGYGTAAHQAALHTLGPCTLHRHTFKPVAAASERLRP